MVKFGEKSFREKALPFESQIEREIRQFRAEIPGKMTALIKCPHCGHRFIIEDGYIGIITCPYCGKYIEG
jgi:DNA-directed RNA polymerase subunit RPC12/RpoP